MFVKENPDRKNFFFPTETDGKVWRTDQPRKGIIIGSPLPPAVSGCFSTTRTKLIWLQEKNVIKEVHGRTAASGLPSPSAMPGVSWFWFVSPGLPVNKRKSPGYHKLVKSPGFFTFISRFFALFACFSAFLLIFRIEKPELSHPLSIIGFESGFCLHLIGNSDGEVISKMASKNAHED